MFLFYLVFAMFCARLFICALWSPAGKGLTSWLSFVVSTVSLHFPIGILGQVWYLIVSIPDLCTLTYFVDCTFLKPNYISHIMKCVSFSADKALPCNSQIHIRYPKIIGIPIVLISSYFLFLRFNINFYLKENY